MRNERSKLLHCYVEKKEGIWQAFCLDFTLAAQGESRDDSIKKLELMIEEYVHDAVYGENKKHAKQLLSRRAPLVYWVKYYVHKVLLHVLRYGEGVSKPSSSEAGRFEVWCFEIAHTPA
uniref:DUF1902 domain-containing protein n=1 Tax=Candidatus Kentrum sp. TC TaxID=2126339 RepID=A0A450Z0V9_9GAMM|nr:MAG: hypothetical protein BECKTC1821E_GA0114239_10841 [Candidatus Kentron sp. TC]VFK48559.1 MAG: hypothetical protein BECKTC1821D_GA0114238_10621 [Candidatus Kentron sp. TC]VFK61896.1 MAG: hypothetical protein BECKTC1821F_GA0114240_10651 [Candidatus Kentron sp. TC]